MRALIEKRFWTFYPLLVLVAMYPLFFLGCDEVNQKVSKWDETSAKYDSLQADYDSLQQDLKQIKNFIIEKADE